MQTAGFLQLNDDNGCTVLLDNYMTMQLSKNEAACKWQILSECDDCACESMWCGVDSIEDAPWFDANNPASAEFFGLFGQLTISQPAPSINYTATGSTRSAPLKQLTFVGALVSCTDRGAVFGNQWLISQLEPRCRPCKGRTATIGAFCASGLCDHEDDNSDGGVAGPVEVVTDWSAVSGLDGCSPAEPLGLTPDPVEPYDNGSRDLIKVRYNPGTYAEIPGSDLPMCMGMRVTFSFTIDDARMFKPATEACVMRSPEPGTACPCCVPISFALDEPVNECGCPTSCDCTTVLPTSEDSPSPGVSLAPCDYSTPLCAKTFACLTSTFSASEAVPTIKVTANDKPLTDVAVFIWEAIAGIPSPSTPEGYAYYAARGPIVEPALIPYVPAYGSKVLDGRERSEYTLCAPLENTRNIADVSQCGGIRYQHPTLCCGRRYWVGLEVGCELDDVSWEVRTELNGFDNV